MDPFCYFVPCLFLSYCLVWERADVFAFLCVMFSYLFITFPYGVLCQVWYLVVSIPDLCFLPYFSGIYLI